MDEHGRIRLRFSKVGKIRFTSHRDVARLWERALRRSGVPVAQSQGFSPHPLVSFGLALPTGCESWGEYLDLRVEGGTDEGEVQELPARLSPLLPEGMAVQAAQAIALSEGSLQQEVAWCDWELEVRGVNGRECQEQVERVLAAPRLTIPHERKGRQTEDDIRPAILNLAVTHHHGPEPERRPTTRLVAQVATHPRGVRPGDLIAALGTHVVLARACRTHQWIERDGARFEPLSVSGLGTGPVVEHAPGRAS